MELYKPIVSFEEFDICRLITIINEFEYESMMDIESCKDCINKLYEHIEGHRGFVSEFDEFAFDEDGDEIVHTKDEYYNFIKSMYNKILIYLYSNSDIVQDLIAEGYQCRDRMYELEKDVQN